MSPDSEEDSFLAGQSKDDRDESTRSTSDSSLSGRSSVHHSTLSDRFFSSLSSRERNQALQTLGIGPAAHLIRDAILGEKSTPEWFNPYQNPHQPIRNIISLICSRLIAHRWMNRLLRATAWILVILSFIETPSWCDNPKYNDLPIVHNATSSNHASDEFGTCGILLRTKGTAVDGTEHVQLYPNFSSMWLTPKQARSVEAWCLSIIFFFLLLQFGKDGMDWRHFFHSGSVAHRLHSLRVILWLVLVLGLLIKNTTYSPFFRLVLLGTHLKTFQKELNSLVRTVRTGSVIPLVGIP